GYHNRYYAEQEYSCIATAKSTHHGRSSPENQGAPAMPSVRNQTIRSGLATPNTGVFLPYGLGPKSRCGSVDPIGQKRTCRHTPAKSAQGPIVQDKSARPQYRNDHARHRLAPLALNDFATPHGYRFLH